MKAQQLLALIDINRDAIATNRGFYFQYLTVAKKWLENYTSNIDKDIFTEVDDDIKEVGEEIIFTQIKCYSSTFSLQSKEIRKAIVNFFALYLKNKDHVENLVFDFITNTTVAKTEEILQKWISEQPIVNKDLLNLCSNKISEILFEEIQKKLEKNNSTKKEENSENIPDFEDIIYDKNIIEDFTGKIFWHFDEIPPEEAIIILTNEIHLLLQDPIFSSRPVKLLMEALLCEIYRRSQEKNPQDRKVTNGILKEILETKDSELTKYIDKRLLNLFNFRLDILEDKLVNIQNILDNSLKVQEQHSDILNKISAEYKKANDFFPHFLTTIPFVNPDNLNGRNDLIDDLKHLLSENKHISVNGNGGMGKSYLIKSFVHKLHSEYDHILWLNVESGLVNSLTTNQQITSSLKIPPLEAGQFNEALNLIIHTLNNIPGQNLLVVDSYDVVEPEMEIVKSLQNWHIIAGTRLRLQDWKNLPIPSLDFEQAKALYLSISNQDPVDDQQFQLLFDSVEYNTLVISLVAKTIQQSFTLTLTDVLKHFQEKSLDDQNIQVQLQNDYGESLSLLIILNKTFDLSKLESIDKYYLSFFALLPLEETDFIDLVDWFGKDSVAPNTIAFTNIINTLHSKGLLERNGKRITMHKMLRESILYQERKDSSPFLNQLFNVINLSARIKEGYNNNLSQALRFLKYGEAILKEIKEPFRTEIYQPMLMLENEVLNIYGWIKKDTMTSRWQDLIDRAEKHLDKNDSLLGIMSNNIALTLAADGELDKSFTYFEKAIEILSVADSKAIPHLLMSMCNMSTLLINNGNFPLFFDYFEKIEKLRKKYDLYDDPSYPIQAQIMGSAYNELSNFPMAIKLYKTAIELHKKLPVEFKNDVFLINYYLKLGYAYVLNKDLENANLAANTAGSIYLDLKLKELNHHIEILKLMILIAELQGDDEGVKILKETLKNTQN
ncbi:dsDNA nuclease domain-containing protein [Chryseobacterium aureum]|uniref:dsDNA nuclease domain-containing protein n=1 Tax=Chryseobacterium aureum TaxID=2497456 RepID=UPI000F87C267|nr:dsDNA nuclease domain-containing protein [Chryseobacterium aureum]